jgi:hypothetical protein
MTPESEGVVPEQRTPMDYGPPRIERVLSPAELEREVLYAGDNASGRPV